MSGGCGISPRAVRLGSKVAGRAAPKVLNVTLSEFRDVGFGVGAGVGVGIGSKPAPGSRLVKVGAGANNDRALASSGILPVLET